MSTDPTEAIRRELEQAWGQVWDSKQLKEDFEVTGFAAPYVVVIRKEDRIRGTLLFQHHPRFYFFWTPHTDTPST